MLAGDEDADCLKRRLYERRFGGGMTREHVEPGRLNGSQHGAGDESAWRFISPCTVNPAAGHPENPS